LLNNKVTKREHVLIATL